MKSSAERRLPLGVHCREQNEGVFPTEQVSGLTRGILQKITEATSKRSSGGEDMSETFRMQLGVNGSCLQKMQIPTKSELLDDLAGLDLSLTWRVDATLANTFFREAIQLLQNAIVLFEQGFFDCAFYSLRQVLEISTTMVYLVEKPEEERRLELRKWKSKGSFPLFQTMIEFLEDNGEVFADMRQKMAPYFGRLKCVKNRLNKHVHKQGFDTFYVVRNGIFAAQYDTDAFVSEFLGFFSECVGAAAVFRLAIDPFPILLMDDEIYLRTPDLLTEPFTTRFVESYLGYETVESYKRTNIFLEHYNSIMQREPMLPSTAEVVKIQYINKSKIPEILTQEHLLSERDAMAVKLAALSPKIAKIYCMGMLLQYDTSTPTRRKERSWSSADFPDLEGNTAYRFNEKYDEAFLSRLRINGTTYHVEHNEIFTVDEQDLLKRFVSAEEFRYAQEHG